MANQPQTQKRISASHRSHEENSSQKWECFKKIYKIEDLFDMDIDHRLSQAWQKISSKKRLLVRVGKVNLAYRKFTIERNEDPSKIAWYKSFDLML
ncbi:hypothetical protein CKAN_00758200 [Cinnamomum micranthum f. kanehirae]|uniref:Uncharacterized protein n=1 Tax=Cinnamomum micranthum f. kanehirae TaxID=337451 RepID=A0A3S4NM71_9MAGN|nr:hypothetical protein CKAN_00758200 [Cinnamomum micranthum f. kanehirae]